MACMSRSTRESLSFLFFFFSSRRRHTRCSRDWSSDVCSSDLWNDPDMLEIGNGGMNDDEYRTQMSLWSILAAPLLAGNDLRGMSPVVFEILTNREVIAVNQDKRGKKSRGGGGVGEKGVWGGAL